ncbi:MAG: WD40 repeat domain-containing protein [Gemmataceae bacterium]|nr:WD40 repeat domain-containing protein [Gemmataceae bacterium]
MRYACCFLMCWSIVAAAQARAEEDPSVLARKAREILKTHCQRCHGSDGKAKGGFDYVLQRDRLVARGKVVPGSPNESELYQRVRDGDMPPRDVKQRLTKDETALLQQWIDAGAPGEKVVAGPRRFVPESEIVHAIRLDLEAMPARQRRFVRYFTLAHLANAGRHDEDLDADRRAQAKLINCLSWHPRITRPVAVDPAQTIYRVDLRDYKWNSRLWDRLVSVYPYRLSAVSNEGKEIATFTGSELAYLRSDWFVATASRAPLYYDLLQMPGTDRGLERLLQVDVPGNIQEETVVRAGFNGSGVSRNNRMIERHDAGYGAYWRTYDFSANTDRQNLFDRPLGPSPAPNAFVHAGGEAIFHLPNGLHGYLLVNADGRRIDKGPVEIVSDPQRPDRAVEAGLSCMSCHARGYLPKSDQIRAHVLKNAMAFPKEQVETVKALYPPEARFKALMDQDNDRYLHGLNKTGVRADDAEPITAVTLRYEGVVDLLGAATEAGLGAEDFKGRLSKSATLARSLGAFLVKGGTVQRQTYQTVFAELARDFKLGEDDVRSVPLTVVERPFTGHTASVLCIAISPDGKQAVSGSEDRTLRLWDTATGKELRRFQGHRDSVAAVAFVSDDVIMSGSHDRTVRLWDAKTGKETKRFEGHTDRVTCVTSFGKDLFASGSQDKTVRIWKLAQADKDAAAVLTGHSGVVNSVQFGPNGTWVLSASADATVRVWHAEEGKQLCALEGHYGAVHVAQFGDGAASVVSGGNDRSVRVWKLPSPLAGTVKESRSFQGHQNAVIQLSVIVGSGHIWSGSSQYQKTDKFLRKWELETGKETADAGVENDRIACIAFSRDGKFALTSGPDQTLRLWKLD